MCVFVYAFSSQIGGYIGGLGEAGLCTIMIKTSIIIKGVFDPSADDVCEPVSFGIPVPFGTNFQPDLCPLYTTYLSYALHTKVSCS